MANHGWLGLIWVHLDPTGECIRVKPFKGTKDERGSLTALATIHGSWVQAHERAGMNRVLPGTCYSTQAVGRWRKILCKISVRQVRLES